MAFTPLTKASLIIATCCLGFGQESYRHYKKCPRPVDQCLQTIVSSYMETAWDGLRVDGVSSSDPVRVVEIEPGSPCIAEGFKVDDILVELNGVPMQTWTNQDLIQAMKSLKVGTVVTYTVQRGDRTFHKQVKMASPPTDLVALWVGNHFIQHHYKKSDVGL